MTQLHIALCAAACLLPAALQAQHQPYAGEEAREIKALSAEEVKQYLSGAGMGYAKAAELNRFPGPAHVLELGDKLGLTPEQRSAVARVMDDHKAEARQLGAKVVESERALDAMFRSGAVGRDALAQAIREAATRAGEYRLSHLEAHRRTRAVLSSEQVTRYNELRGYANPAVEDDLHRH